MSEGDSPRNPVSVRRTPTGVIAALAVIVALTGLTATALARSAFTMYDEGVYYYQAVLLARGEIPYRDFFCPQPPGVLLLGASSERIGGSIVGVRVVSWLCGLVLLVQTYTLTRRLGGEETKYCGVMASAFVAVTVVFAYQSIQGATNMPAGCLELAACLLALGEGRKRFILAGLVLAAATVLRLQAVVALPGLLLLVRVAGGRNGFWLRATWLVGSLAIACATIHLMFAATLPGYIDNVVGFQTARVRTSWSERSGQVLEFLSEPVTLLGLLAAMWFAVMGERRLRGLALHAIVTASLITVAGNSLSVMYYLPVLPLLAVCATLALIQFTRTRSWILPAIPLVITAIHGPWVTTVILAQTATNDEHTACVALLRELPGETVLTSDGRIAILAGKRLPANYYATDPNALYLLAPERFHAWFTETLPESDTVVITPQLLMWMSPVNAEAVRKSGKPVLFDRKDTRDTFEAMYGSVP